MEVTIGENAVKATTEKVAAHFSDKYPTNTICPVRDIISRISDKWSIHAIIMLGKTEKLRFGELKKGIEGISQRMLTVTLRNMEEDGFITRTVYAQIPPRVEYQLTPLGRSLLGQLIGLSEWATANMDDVVKSRRKYAKANLPENSY